MHTYKAKILSVYDGDTFTADIDLGFDVWITRKLRLLGVNAPELKGPERPEGLRVRDVVKPLIEGKDVTIQTVKDDLHDSFGRYLARVWIEGVELGDLLLSENMARPFMREVMEEEVPAADKKE